MKKNFSIVLLIAALLFTSCGKKDSPTPNPPGGNNTISVTGVTLNKTTASLVAGATDSLKATVAPANATNKAVTWKSSDATVSTVDANGKITALKAGSATITVTTTDGSKTAACTVTVSAVAASVSIISFSPTSAGYDATITITGTGFSTTAANNMVTLNGISVQVLSANATQLTVKVPKNKNATGVLRVQVQGGGTANAATPFTYSLTYTVSTLAGGGANLAGYIDATGEAARFSTPTGIAVDANGNVYVADTYNHRIRKITPNGVVTTFAGSGSPTNVDVEGDATKASFNLPRGITVDANGNVYVSNSPNRIRKISADGKAVTTLALITGPDTHNPDAMTIGADGNIYVVDKISGHRIYKITPTGTVTTLAGSGVAGHADATGEAAQFNQPSGIIMDSKGNVYVGDDLNNRIRKITSSGEVTTFAGSGTAGFADGKGIMAQFFSPHGVVMDASGNIYVADYTNRRIRMVDVDGIVTTIAGSGTLGNKDGIGTGGSTFNSPSGIAIDEAGNLYVSDLGSHRIRKIVLE